MSEYILGTNRTEWERLCLQQRVWGGVSDAFLERLGVASGWSCLDLGCGPGLTLPSLRSRIGESGSIVALDESPLWHEHVGELVRAEGWRNVRQIEARIEEAELAPQSFDLIFARWVLSFLPRCEELIGRLASLLRPGGVLALQDYNHEGISIFPESEDFRVVVQATREMFRASGGDLFVAGRLPGYLRAAGLELCEFHSTVLCGGPDSGAFTWADAFFPHHSQAMLDKGLIDTEQRERFLEQWSERRANPDAVFFSPIVVDVAAKKSA